MATTDAKGVTDSALQPSPTSPQEDRMAGLYASYVPHDLQYSSAFEDELISAVLDDTKGEGSGPSPGIRVLSPENSEAPEPGKSVRASDVDPQSLPVIHEDELPLRLDDSRRIYASPVVGINLTHPGGYLEGGPGLDADMDTFPDDFLSTHANTITSPETLQAAIDKEIATSVEMLKERLEARRRAREKNEQIEREMKVLTDQHSMELRIQSRMAEERRKKKEAREGKKREGG